MQPLTVQEFGRALSVLYLFLVDSQAFLVLKELQATGVTFLI